jgi:hypothetical protein
MVKTPFDSARVIWSSSLEASHKFYDSEDWQLTKTGHSYESSKYQIDIIAINLDHIALNSKEEKPIRHFVCEPGVCSTSISKALASGILDYIKTFMFYFVSSPFLFFFFWVILTRIRLAYVVRHIIPSILSKLLLSLCILSLFLYALYHSFWITIVASLCVLEHKLDVGVMNVLV